MTNVSNETILLVFVAITAVALLIQAIVLLALYLTLRKTANSLLDQVDEVRSALMPLITNSTKVFTRVLPKVEATVDTSQALLNRLSPKIENAVSDFSDIADQVKAQTAEMQVAASEIVDRVRTQSARVDSMCSGVLDAVERAGDFVAHTVSKPVRQMSAIMASIKAVVESLRTAPPPRHSPVAASTDKDMSA